MKKKILLSFLALAIAIGIVPMFAAFEAHVINVTAKIENALRVTTDAIDFGTVFPQEHLDRPLEIALSDSFIAEDRVDDVQYIIRQKPKCGLTNEDGTELIGPTATGHVIVDPDTGEVTIDCGPAPTDAAGTPLPGNWGVLPSLCEYVSKEGEDDNDEIQPSFHEPWVVVQDASSGEYKLVWTDTAGYLSKIAGDEVDNWTIDLSVPCFGEHCAQDWANWVTSINPLANPDDYVQDPDNEHKIFGCDLWVEVTGVSEAID